ncbi:ABC transporter substrate-binding protein [Novosphingobium pituita]|jgi:phospholipid transport system substrate-binding protein|uniref:Hopanoid biosynthesis protein HpnM n=1 Tax=Novosphingobium pituita TaxID=3056842 RepID=A0ABQ6P6E2_9SPHN|nr:ABC transporter substrate-binding protein [Novosphingobium sp. IK01]MDK4807620.1 ABC transporter substrate-binding protein [Novosphingobium aromaticivorans]GMM60812.1 hypothetical protein NUTIK01_15890 [Novosphingobium sp. IK01]
MRFVPRALVATSVTLAAVMTVSTAQAATPAEAVSALDSGLLAIMKAGKGAGLQGRKARIAPVIDQAFDLPLMARLSVGSAWTGFSPADQKDLVASFRRMVIAEYARNFDGWSGQSFAVSPDVQTRGTDSLVRTVLHDPKGKDVAISYRLRQSGGTWKIIDVFYNNSISQIATRRSDFAIALQKGGARSLIGHLDQLAARTN